MNRRSFTTISATIASTAATGAVTPQPPPFAPEFNRDYAREETAYIQEGDVPGRKEPTTGEINYTTICKHLYDKGYKGIVGMEHGIKRPGIKGKKRLIQAYREVDDFET